MNSVFQIYDDVKLAVERIWYQTPCRSGYQILFDPYHEKWTCFPGMNGAQLGIYLDGVHAGRAIKLQRYPGWIAIPSEGRKGRDSIVLVADVTSVILQSFTAKFASKFQSKVLPYLGLLTLTEITYRIGQVRLDELDVYIEAQKFIVLKNLKLASFLKELTPEELLFIFFGLIDRSRCKVDGVIPMSAWITPLRAIRSKSSFFPAEDPDKFLNDLLDIFGRFTSKYRDLIIVNAGKGKYPRYFAYSPEKQAINVLLSYSLGYTDFFVSREKFHEFYKTNPIHSCYALTNTLKVESALKSLKEFLDQMYLGSLLLLSRFVGHRKTDLEKFEAFLVSKMLDR